jgi:hypothetical protein
MTARRSPRWSLGLCAIVALGSFGCSRGLDMATAYDAKRPAATIPYAGVGEVTRQYPDYSVIKGDILTEVPEEPKPSAKKKGRSF